MKIKNILLFAVPAMAMTGLAGCAPKYDVKIVIYNWADYIYNSFIKLRNNRSVYNVEKFSFDKFRKQLIDLYR